MLLLLLSERASSTPLTRDVRASQFCAIIWWIMDPTEVKRIEELSEIFLKAMESKTINEGVLLMRKYWFCDEE